MQKDFPRNTRMTRKQIKEGFTQIWIKQSLFSEEISLCFPNRRIHFVLFRVFRAVAACSQPGTCPRTYVRGKWAHRLKSPQSSIHT